MTWILLPLPSSGATFVARDLTMPHVTIGRSLDSVVVVPHETVSRRHASLTVDKAQLTIAPASAANGVFVNGTRVNEAVLHHGDAIHFGAIGAIVIDTTALGTSLVPAGDASLSQTRIDDLEDRAAALAAALAERNDEIERLMAQRTTTIEPANLTADDIGISAPSLLGDAAIGDAPPSGESLTAPEAVADAWRDAIGAVAAGAVADAIELAIEERAVPLHLNLSAAVVVGIELPLGTVMHAADDEDAGAERVNAWSAVCLETIVRHRGHLLTSLAGTFWSVFTSPDEAWEAMQAFADQAPTDGQWRGVMHVGEVVQGVVGDQVQGTVAAFGTALSDATALLHATEVGTTTITESAKVGLPSAATAMLTRLGKSRVVDKTLLLYECQFARRKIAADASSEGT